MRRLDLLGAGIGMIVGGALGLVGGGAGIVLGLAVGLIAGLAIGIAAQRARAQAQGAATARRRERIDPFTVDDPWRRLVQQALSAQREFDEAVRRTPAGPIRDRMQTIGGEVGESVTDVWAAARAGHDLAAAHRRLDAPSVKRRRDALGDGALEESTKATADALDAQLATADRIKSTIDSTRTRLDVLNARLDETVARTIELSVGAATPDAFSEVEQRVGAISDELEALRSALADTAAAERGEVAMPAPVEPPEPRGGTA